MKKHLLKRGVAKLIRSFNSSYMPVMPSQLFLELTTICNLKCRTCYRSVADLPSRDIPKQLLDKITRELFLEIYHLEIIGLGEALCSSCFWNLMEQCKQYEIRVGTSTNGLLITRETAGRLAEYGAMMVLSLDGKSNQTLDYIRSGVTADKMQKAMRNFQEAKDKYPDSGFSWSVHTVVIKRNVLELPDMIRWANSFGCNRFSFSHFDIYNRQDEFISETLINNPEPFLKMLPDIKAIAAERNLKLVIPPMLLQKRRSQNEEKQSKKTAKYFQKCYSPWRETQITLNGDVHSCCVLGEVLGNMNSQSFKEIWNGKKYKAFRRAIHSGNPPNVCRHCTMDYGITGGDPSYFDNS